MGTTSRGARWACVVAMGAMVGAPGVAVSAGGEPAGPPARVRLSTSLLDETVKGLLPLAISVPPPSGPGPDGGVTAPASAVPATLMDLRYCGATEHGAGRFRAAIRLAGIPAGTTGASAAPAFGEVDCGISLGDLGKRIGAANAARIAGDGAGQRDDATLVLADLEATWRAWELRLTVARVVSIGERRADSGWNDARKSVLMFSTAGLVLPTDNGPLVLHAWPAFAADAVEISALLGEPGVAPPSIRAPSAPAPAGAAMAGNATIELPYALANQVLRAQTARPIAVRVGRDTVDVQDASLRASAGSVTVTAMATSRAVPESARVHVSAGGDDLRIGTVRAEAQLESCAGLGVLASVGCNARNAARAAAAAALGAAGTDRYQGQLLRELADVRELRFGSERREVRLGAEALRIAATARGLTVDARLTPHDPGPPPAP